MATWLLAGKISMQNDYYFFPDGHMATGVQIVDGKKWEFGSDDVLIIKNGWHLEGDTWFYYINSEKRTGWLFQVEIGIG